MSRAKRLLIVSDRFPPHDRGGSERIAHLNALGFRDRGWNVAVFTSFAPVPGERPGVHDEDGLRVYRAFPLHPFTAGERGSNADRVAELGLELWNPFVGRKLEDVAAEFAPDLLHGHYIPRISFRAFSASASSTPRVLTFHSYHFECPKGGLYRKRGEICTKKPIPCQLFEGGMIRTLARVDRVIAISRFIERRLLEAGMPRERVVWLPNGVPLEPMDARSPSRSRTVLFVGRLEPNKGANVLVRAFRAIDDPGARLRIVGAGSELEKLRRLAGGDPRIELAGWLGRGELGAAYRESRVVVVPSVYHEGLNTVLCEAAAHGRALVASDLGGNSDLVVEGSGGFLVPGQDVPALAARIRELLADDALADQLGSAARRHIEGFSLDRHLSALDRLYAEILDPQARTAHRS